jgi:hypothetical protein
VAHDKKFNLSIIFIGDLPYRLSENEILIEQDEGYVDACYKIAQLIRSEESLKIWARSRTHFTWLKNFIGQLNITARFEEKTARSILAEKWNVNLPHWLSDTDVLDYNLLDLKIDAKTFMGFEERFLTHFLDSVFQREQINANDIPDVIESLTENETKKLFKQYPLLQRCLQSKCDSWAATGNQKWIEDFCKQISVDYLQVWKSLTFWSGLNSYPKELLEYVMTPEQISFVKKIPPEALSALPFNSEAQDQIVTQIEIFFSKISEELNSSSEFQKVVASTSGKLYKEYQLVIDLLNRKQFEPTQADIKAVQEKFRSCPNVSGFQLKSLNNMIKPKKPSILEEGGEWNHTEWINWITKEYVPYRNWQIYNNYYDDEVEKTVIKFTDWMIDNYISIHGNPDLSLAYSLEKITSDASKRELIIVVIIDCLPLQFMEIVDEILRNIGLHRHYLKHKFAGLPSTTEFNKSALLNGKWQHEQEESYENILKRRSKTDWKTAKTIYLPNLKAFDNMTIQQESTIAVLNFLESDELFHSDVESKNATYEDEFYRIFSRVSEIIKKLSNDWNGPSDLFSILIATDHGACRILDEEKKSFDSLIIKKMFEDEKYRFSSIPKDKENDIPQNLWLLGHKFIPPFNSDKKTYFLPKGHNTVRHAKRVSGYMHGGVTPEEILVPFAKYKLIEAAWKNITGRFLNLNLDRETGKAMFYIQRIVDLDIELLNPNNVEVKVLRAIVNSPENDLKSFKSITIPAKSKNIIELKCYFMKSAMEQNNLEIEIVYEIGGEQRIFPIELKSEFKSASKTGFSLKDLKKK